MLRTAPRQVLRHSSLPVRAHRIGVRYQSTVPPKRRTLKNSFARWAIAIGGVYWYNTSPIFNEPPAYTVQTNDSDSEELLPTIASVAASSRFKPPHPSDAPIVASTPSVNSPPSINPKSPDPRDPNAPKTAAFTEEPAAQPGDPRSLEQEAAQQGAFNEETGEINWDCPCLGGMAYGPCGPEFREAFSCFVYSDKEPKGVDCIDRFERMQTCFRAHPEIYAAEIEDDESMQKELEEEVGRGAPPAGAGGGGAAKAGKDTPEVDEPSVWTPVVVGGGGGGQEAPKAPPADVKPKAKPSQTSESRSSPPPATSSPAKPSNTKKPVYDEPEVKAVTIDEASSSKPKEGQEPPKATQKEGEGAVPKAAFDAR